MTEIHREEHNDLNREMTAEEKLMDELRLKVERMVTSFMDEHKLKAASTFTIACPTGFSASCFYNALGPKGFSLMLQALVTLEDEIAKRGIQQILDLLAQEGRNLCTDAEDVTIN